MALSDRMRERSSAIAARWLADTLATYGERAAAAFRSQQDPFANPVGHALQVGTRAAVEALLAEKDAGEICSHLDGIIKIRAVQEFRPSQAISFVLLLKEALRAELESEDQGITAGCGELARLDRKIDHVLLAAFDVYVRYRSQVFELRANEAKRSVAMLLQCANRRRSAERDQDGLELSAATGSEAERGGGR